MLLLFFLSSFFSYLFLLSLIPLLRLKLLDLPNSRSSHVVPVPRGGGVSFVLFGLIAALFALFPLYPFLEPTSSQLPLTILWVPVISSFLAALGFIDDYFNLSVRVRLIFQIIVALGLTCLSSFSFPYLFIPFVCFFIIAIINFTNFMDGVDGLVAGCMTVTLLSYCYRYLAPWPLWVLTGSLFGFLLLNWSPSKVFMGDVGSTFLGAVFVGLVLQLSNPFDALSLLLVSTPLFADAFVCLIRRLLIGHRVTEAHCLHLFQRLHQAGWSHRKVALTYVFATSVLALSMLLLGFIWLLFLSLIVLIFGIFLDKNFAVPFSVASKR